MSSPKQASELVVAHHQMKSLLAGVTGRGRKADESRNRIREAYVKGVDEILAKNKAIRADPRTGRK